MLDTLIFSRSAFSPFPFYHNISSSLAPPPYTPYPTPTPHTRTHTHVIHLHGRQSSGRCPKSNEQRLSRMNAAAEEKTDATPFFVRFEQSQCCSLEPAEPLGVHPGYLAQGNPVNVAGVADGDASRAAGFCSVGTRSLVFAPGALGVEITQEVLPEVWPVGHRTVPRAVGKLLGQRCVPVIGEAKSHSSLKFRVVPTNAPHAENRSRVHKIRSSRRTTPGQRAGKEVS